MPAISLAFEVLGRSGCRRLGKVVPMCLGQYHLAPLFSSAFPMRRALNLAILISSSVFSLTRFERTASNWAIMSSGVASCRRFLSYECGVSPSFFIDWKPS